MGHPVFRLFGVPIPAPRSQWGKVRKALLKKVKRPDETKQPPRAEMERRVGQALASLFGQPNALARCSCGQPLAACQCEAAPATHTPRRRSGLRTPAAAIIANCDDVKIQPLAEASPSPARMTNFNGNVLQFTRWLGGGSFGQVFQATWGAQNVAVKVVERAPTLPMEGQVFFHEKAMLELFQKSPFIIKLLGTRITDFNAQFFLELYDMDFANKNLGCPWFAM